MPLPCEACASTGQQDGATCGICHGRGELWHTYEDDPILKAIEEDPDPNVRVAFQIVRRIHLGMGSDQEDELRTLNYFIIEMFKQKLAQWGDAERTLRWMAEQIYRRFPIEEFTKSGRERRPDNARSDGA